MGDHIDKNSDLPKTLAGLTSRINNGKNNKKLLWIEFAKKLTSAHGKTFLPEKVKRKWHRLMESFKKAKDNNNSTGRAPSKFPFMAEIEELIGADHDISFPVTATGNGISFNTDQQVCRFVMLL